MHVDDRGASLLGIGCLFTILYLVADGAERRRVAGSAAPRRRRSWAARSTWTPTPARPRAPTTRSRSAETAPAPRRALPSAATLDRLAYRFIAFGFPIWTFGVICGAIWAQEAWARYWGWDPKETWSFITWVIFAGYLHARATSGGRAARPPSSRWSGS